MIKHIVALSSVNGAIGLFNKLPWHIPEDLKHFKELTLGKTVYMGTNTFKSILPFVKDGKFLEGRQVVVVSSTLTNAVKIFTEYHSQYENVFCTHIEQLKEEVKWMPDNEFIIVGGSKLYEAFTPDVIEATLVDIDVQNADAFYPFLVEKYKMVSSTAKKFVDGKPSYSFCKFVK